MANASPHVDGKNADFLPTGQCKLLRPVSDKLIQTGRYYVVASMNLLASTNADASSSPVAAFLVAAGPDLGDWKLLAADADEDQMTQLCTLASGSGARVRSSGYFWNDPDVRLASASTSDGAGCKVGDSAAVDHCQTLITYLQQQQRHSPVSLILPERPRDTSWISLMAGASEDSFKLQQHRSDGSTTTLGVATDFHWKPNLDQALQADPLLPLDHVRLRKGDEAALSAPSVMSARQMESNDDNYDIDLFWGGADIQPLRDAQLAQQADPPRAYEVQVLGDGGKRVLDTLYTYQPYLKYLTPRQRRVNTYVFDHDISVRIRSLGQGRLAGAWRTFLKVPVRRDYPHVVFTGGQSNVEAWFNHLSGKTDDQEARTTFRRSIAQSMGVPPYDVAVVNVAQGGSAVDRVARSAPEHYWYDVDKDQPGPLLTEAMTRMAMWRHVDLMVWVQGERETFAEAMGEHHPGEATASTIRWERATAAIFKRLRHTAGTAENMPIVLQGLGRLWYAGKQVNETQRDEYLAAQVGLACADPATWYGADASEFTLQDYQPLLPSKVHYGPGMYHLLAARMGRFVGDLLAGGSPQQPWPSGDAHDCP